MEFRLLGSFEVEDGDRRLTPARRHERVLLGVLLLEAGTAVPTDRLADLLWDDEPPARARATMQTYISRLRAGLDPDGDGAHGFQLVRAGDGYAAQVDPEAVDALRFRALVERARAEDDAARRAGLLRRALELWKGPPLAGDASDLLRTRLIAPWQEMRLSALEAAVEAEMDDGRHGSVIGELRSLVAEFPYREHFTALLMLALYRAGRQAEALVAYQDARRALTDQLGVEPGSELRDLHQRILAGDRELLPTRDGGAETAAAPTAAQQPAAAPAPRQLPAATRHFIGRRDELDQLTSLIEQTGTAGGTVVISAIDGMAGIGKTALAVHGAHRLAEKFPDGQLFIDLHGYTQGHEPRTAGQALDTFLHALGVPAQRIPQDVDARATLYRERLAGTRTLIVLDNASDEAQVRPLLPGDAGCLVLVTSRRRLRALDDAYPLSLDALPPADAVALLRTVAGPGRIAADDPEPAEIAELCGRLPLALRIAAALLRHRPAWTAQHLAGLLRDREDRITLLSDNDRELSALFDLSYQSLPADQQRLFRGLGLIPGPDTDDRAAAALIGADPATADRLLEALVDQNLVISHVPGRYRLHDLLRAYTRMLAAVDPEDDRKAALGRLLDYYEHAAGRADLLITRYPRPTPDAVPNKLAPAYAPDLPDVETAFKWLRTERANLLAALEQATADGRDQHVIALTAGLAALLANDGPWALSITLHTAAAETARRHDDRLGHAHALTQLGEARGRNGDYPGAIGDLDQALDLARSLDDRLGQANVLAARGAVHRLTGDFPDATGDLQQALTLYQETDCAVGQANTLGLLADMWRMTGDFTGAADAFQRSLELYRALNHRAGQAKALANLGGVRRMTGDLRGAIRDLQESLDLYQGSDEQSGQALALMYLGECRKATGDLPEAARTVQRAVDLQAGLGSRLGEASALNTLGEIRGRMGEHAEALRDLRRALDLYTGLESRLGQGITLSKTGLVRHLSGDLSGAAADLLAALEIFRSLGSPGNEAWALNMYAPVVVATGDHAQALVLFQDALRLGRETRQTDEEAFALEGIGGCHLHAGDTEAAVSHLEQALEIYRRLDMPADAERVQARIAQAEGGAAPSRTP